MSTPQRCIAQAEEAERLAALVSYARDRARLTREAAEWRARAVELEASAPPAPEDGTSAPTGVRRLAAWLRAPRSRER